MTASDRVVLPTIGLASAVVVGAVVVLILSPSITRGGGIDTSALPAVNATLNGTNAVLLVTGFLFIRRRAVRAHMTTMIAAFGLSTLFLISYVTYHAQAGSHRFTGLGVVRVVYFAVLISHVVLAAIIVPLVLVTLHRAWRGDFARHRRIARWTFPIWLYVSVTGVVVYVMLYHGPW